VLLRHLFAVDLGLRFFATVGRVFGALAVGIALLALRLHARQAAA
jgi:hypothetical protein